VSGPPPAPSPRVVSLVPSVTETLLAWDVVPAACTRFCEQPDLPHVGGTKDPDVSAIVGLAPDLVVRCVEENRREDADALAAAGVATASLSIDAVADVASGLRMLAGLVGAEHAAAGDIAAVEAAAGSQPAGSSGSGSGTAARLRAFVPVWKRPWMTLSGGTYGSSLLAALGVVNVFADAPVRYPTVTLDEVRARRPDVVLAPSEPYPFGERHVPLFADVAPVVLVDGQDLFWWGVRTAQAMPRLAAQLASVAPGAG
jgi:ABC-type Fe3+-hydroxamate transport system substrate-binding protein